MENVPTSENRPGGATPDESGPRLRPTSKAEEARHAGHAANVAELMSFENKRVAGETRDKHIEALVKRRGELKKEMEEMGGVWGGENYFLKADELEELDRNLRLAVTGTSERPPKVEERLPATEEALVMGESTPEDRIADARKTLKFIEDSSSEISARQESVMEELNKHGFYSTADIQNELAELEPELREETMGIKPSWRYRLGKFARGLAGVERSPETKALLKEYVDLEGQANAQHHMRADAEAELSAAETATGRRKPSAISDLRRYERKYPVRKPESTDIDFSGYGKTFSEAHAAHAGTAHLEQELEALKHLEEGSVGKEQAAIRALKGLEEEIQDAMMNLGMKKGEFEPEDLELYTEKMDSLKDRLSALYDQTGTSPAEVKALKEAEEAYAQFRRQASRAASAVVGQARTAGPGEARPVSVIGMRGGRAGTYGTARADRQVVQLSNVETADTRAHRAAAAERSEAAAAAERVNKEVQMYRSEKWRKELIDKINTNESVRSAMHAAYEAYKNRAQELMQQGLDMSTDSPDPALDYALNLYRLNAHRADGRHAYNKEIRAAARQEVNMTDELLGAGWDGGASSERVMNALWSGRPKVEAVKPEAEMELSESDLEELLESRPANEEPEPIPLTRVKTYKRKVEPVSAETIARINRAAEESFAASLAEEEPLPHVKRATSERERVAAEEAEIPERVEVEAEPRTTLTIAEMTERLKAVDQATLNEARKIVGLASRMSRPKNIAQQYDLLVRQSADLPTAAGRIQKLHDLLGISFGEAPAAEATPASAEASAGRPASAQEVPVVESPEEDLSGFRPAGEVLKEEAVSPKPKRVRGRAYENAEAEEAALEEIEARFIKIENDENKVKRLAGELQRYQGEGLVDKYNDLVKKIAAAQEGARKNWMKRHLKEIDEILSEEPSVKEAPVVKEVSKKKAEEPLTRQERNLMYRRLSQMGQGLNDEQRKQLFHIFGSAGKAAYVDAYDQYVRSSGDSRQAVEARGMLEAANKILGIKRPSDLLVETTGPSEKEQKPSAPKSVQSAPRTESRPQPALQARPKPAQPAARPAQVVPQGRHVSTMTEIHRAIAERKAQEAARQQAAVETPPAETPPVETPPVETPPVETPPVETPPVETPPVETPPTRGRVIELDPARRRAEERNRAKRNKRERK